MGSITRELEVPPRPPRELDHAVSNPTAEEWDFLHTSVSKDDDEVRRRVFEVQKETYDFYPYPCIYMFHFTSLMMSTNPVYPEVIEAGEKGDTLFLDLGCCMGTDVRKLILDGYPGHNILGCDLREVFIEAGYKLFADKESTPIHFFSGDIFELSVRRADPPPITALSDVRFLEELKGRLSHIYTGALFHLFNEETQYAIAIRLALLLKDGPGGVIFGRHQGKAEPGIIDDDMGRERYGHNPESWAVMWRKVFAELKGNDFAAAHVSVEAKFLNINSANTPRPFLFWSVRVA